MCRFTQKSIGDSLKTKENSEKYRKTVKVETPGKKRYNTADIRRERTYETIIFGM